MKNYNPKLTPTEINVLQLTFQGKTQEQICGTLDIGKMTIKAHIRNINTKLETKNRLAAVYKALSMGILEAPNAIKS